MKKNKKLQNYADKSLERFENDAILEELKEQVRPKKKFSFKWAFVATPCLVFILCLSIFLVTTKKEKAPENNYSSSEFLTSDTSIEELNAVTKDVDFNFIEGCSLLKSIDSVSKETFYYILTYANNETFDNLQIIVVVDKEFKYPFMDIELRNQAQISDFTLNYYEHKNVMQGVIKWEIYGKLDTEETKVYINYSAFTFEDGNNFLTLMRQIVK